MNVLPGLLGLLGVLVALSAGCLLVSLEGFGEEGIADNPNRTLGLVYTRFFTRYEVCIFTPDRSCLLYTSSCICLRPLFGPLGFRLFFYHIIRAPRRKHLRGKNLFVCPGFHKTCTGGRRPTPFFGISAACIPSA